MQRLKMRALSLPLRAAVAVLRGHPVMAFTSSSGMLTLNSPTLF